MEFDFWRRQAMAIVNVTPDSFYAGSRTFDGEALEKRVERVLEAGASIVDIGGYSSRPGAADVSPDEEWRRVDRGLGVVRNLSAGIPVSVDTFRSKIVRLAAEKYGRVIVNDISAGELDPSMVATVVEYDLPYIAMHMKGTPQNMQSLTGYRRDIVTEVVAYFENRCARLIAAGMRREHIVIDPGFGFAKTLEQNYELLAGLRRLCALGYPVLAGLSRKSMIYKAIGATPAESLAGTVVLGWECLRQGATILRVHDVRAAVDTVRIFDIYERSGGRFDR